MINSETQGHFVTYSPQMKRFVLEKEEYYKILKGGSTPIFNSHYVTFVKAMGFISYNTTIILIFYLHIIKKDEKRQSPIIKNRQEV